MGAALTHYFDYKSPYAYLAQAETFALRDSLGVAVDWLPYTLDIPSYLGDAELDVDGRDTVGIRNEHQWRRVRYSYMDCRRQANRRGLILRGPRRIFDSSLAHIAFLYAKRHGDFRPFHERVFERFWKRELDIENQDTIVHELEQAGVDVADFAAYVAGDGRNEHDRIRAEAEERGVFGVPSYLVGNKLFWGAERIALVRERLTT